MRWALGSPFPLASQIAAQGLKRKTQLSLSHPCSYPQRAPYALESFDSRPDRLRDPSRPTIAPLLTP